MANDVTGNQVVSGDFLRVLLALKDCIMRNCNVADIAKVTRINSNTYDCTAIGNSNTIYSAISLQGLDIRQNDAVLILFTNTDFRVNLNKLKNGQALQNQTETTDLHSTSYGVIIGVVYGEREPVEEEK